VAKLRGYAFFDPRLCERADILNGVSDLGFHVTPGGALRGRFRVPGDKSISHRAVMLGSVADGVTEISGFLEGEDSLATLNAFRRMGVSIEGPDAGRVRIQGAGLNGLRQPGSDLDLGNSGTSMRLLSGLLCGQRFAATLVGDASLCSRPMRRVTEPLERMGARIGTTDQGTAPLRIRPVASIRPLDYEMPVASAQVKSCLLLAGLYARGETCVTEPAPTRDHTERMLAGFGYPVHRDGPRVCVSGGGRLTACQLDVPGDISSAAFFLVGASIAPGSDLILEHVGVNPTRIGLLNILRAMGADIWIENPRDAGGEPVADLHVRSAALRGIDIPRDQVPLAIDEFPALFIAAACAEGETVLTGAEELRVKESDRIQVMADGLAGLGIDAQARADGIRIRGGAFGGAVLDSHGDHRVAMSFAMAALRARDVIEIRDCANVRTSFPGFAPLASRAGLAIEERVL
jgi:3-phosphoshikimate 1-carboxyvinyltransferase